MGLIETADGFVLPRPEGPIRSRFDGAQHEHLKNLNAELNELGRDHKAPLRDFGPVYYDEYFGGDPCILSELLPRCADSLQNSDKFELALGVLDQGLRWPYTRVQGNSYTKLARSAAEKNYVDLALGIALDPGRILAGRRPATFEELPDEYNEEHTVALAAEWLGEACQIYQCTIGPCRRRIPERLGDYFLSVVDAHTDLLANALPQVNLAEVADIVPRDISVVQQLGFACQALRSAQQIPRAERLAGLHPWVPYHPPQEVPSVTDEAKQTSAA